MDSVTRWQAKAALTFLIAAFVLLVGAAALYLIFVINPLHTNPASVSTARADGIPALYAAAGEKTEPLVRALLVRKNIPGLSIAVAVDGQIVWAEGFGYADLVEFKPMTPLTRFHLGSISKTLTAAGVALLHDRGRIDLDAAVQQYVPTYPQKAWTVTPRQLLGDVAGVHKIRDNDDQRPVGYCSNLSEALKKFSDEPLLFEPGTSYRFSNNGWVLLSAVVEGAAAEPFSAFMTREVFAPLGMTRTMIEGTDATPDLASNTESMDRMWRKLGVRSEPPPKANYSCFAGAGAFLSTPSDMVRLGSAMLKPGFLKKDTLAVFLEPLRLKSGASTGFALGWKVDTIPFAGGQVRTVRHRAAPFGGAVSLMMIPERNLVIAVFSNGGDLETVDPLALQVAETFASK